MVNVIHLATKFGRGQFTNLSTKYSSFGNLLGSNNGYDFPHTLIENRRRARYMHTAMLAEKRREYTSARCNSFYA